MVGDTSDALFARLALSRGWISPEDHDYTLKRLSEFKKSGVVKTAEDIFVEEDFISSKQLQILKKLTGRYSEQIRIGDYHLVRRIGMGGTGVVFEARHRRLGRRVALKVLFPKIEKEREGFAERFLREARVLARVDDPRVIHPYDAGQDGDFYYIATEIVQGKDLARMIESDGPLPVKQSLDILEEVASGLGAIHRAGLVHRDIKPANILVSDEDGAIKIADLGLFFADFDQQVYWDGLVFGTPQYMSPEQIRGEKSIDGRADLYSLGATLFFILTGKVLFPRDSSPEVVRAQVQEVPPRPSSHRGEIPEALDEFVLKLLNKKPEDRFQTAEQVLTEIKTLRESLPTEQEPIESQPVKEWYPKLSKQAQAKEARPPEPKSPPVTPSKGAPTLPRWVLVVGALSLIAGLGLGLWLSLFNSDPNDTQESQSGDDPKVEVVEPSPPSPNLDRSQIDRWVQDISDTVQSVWQTIKDPFSEETDEDPSFVTRVAKIVLNELGSPEEPAVGIPEKVDPTLNLPEPVLLWAEPLKNRLEERVLSVWKTKEEAGDEIWVPNPVSLNRAWEAAEFQTKSEALHYVLKENSFPVTELDRVVWIVWGAFDGTQDHHLYEGIAASLIWGKPSIAKWIKEKLKLKLPRPVENYLDSDAIPQNIPLVLSEYLEERIAPVLLDHKAWLAQSTGRWQECLSLYSTLLNSQEFPKSFLGREALWVERNQRAIWMRDVEQYFFKVPVRFEAPVENELISVQHPFDRWDEMGDFRFRGAGWAFRDGRLARVGNRRGPETLDTVAIFQLPVSIEGKWRPGRNFEDKGKFVIRFQDLCLGFGGSRQALEIYKHSEENEDQFWEQKSQGVEGDFKIELHANRVRAKLPSGVTFDTTLDIDIPSWGRIGIDLDRKAQLETFKFTGTLHPDWVHARREALGLSSPRK